MGNGLTDNEDIIVMLEKQLGIDCAGGVRMKEERAGKYTVKWHGIKDKSGVLHPPDQLPEEMIDSIVNVILKEAAIKLIPVNLNKDRVVYAKKIKEFVK